MKLSLNREKLLSPHGLFFLYIIISSIIIGVFRMILPVEKTPIEYFSTTWRFLGCWEELIIIFPALALSAIVIPFGLQHNPEDEFTPFSPQFLKKISPYIVNSIIAAAVYAVLCILVLPLVNNHKTDLRAQGQLYRLSAERARYYSYREEWYETARFLDICERIWPKSPDIEKLLNETNIMLSEISLKQPAMDNVVLASRYDITESGSLTHLQAMDLARAAMLEERFFDAHWLASVAGELAVNGSIEMRNAIELASRAWNEVSSIEPNSRETEAYRIYHLKRDAYRALMANDWIQSYYLFRDLLRYSPNDPDGHHYIALCEEGLARIAFFVDEMELVESPSGALFSLPAGTGRIVMRFSSLSLFPDVAYGVGLEVLAFNNGRLLWRLDSPYVKILPLSDASRNVSILMRALDRHDINRKWEPVISGFSEAGPLNAQLTIETEWQEFKLLAEIHKNHKELSPFELMTVSGFGSDFGFAPEIFEAQIIFRFAEPVLFLPFLILTLSAGWRLRTLKKARYIWVPMLGILPLIFSGVFHFFRNCLNDVTVWAVFSFGFSLAVIMFVVGALVLFLVSLIILASQHE